jgi:hypothetical protein
VDDGDLVDYDDDAAADDEEEDMDPIREEDEAENGGDRTSRSASAKMPMLSSRAKFTRTPGSRGSDQPDTLHREFEPPEENGLINEDDDRLSETEYVLITEVKDQGEEVEMSRGSEDGRDTVEREEEEMLSGEFEEDETSEAGEDVKGSDEECDTDLEVDDGE